MTSIANAVADFASAADPECRRSLCRLIREGTINANSSPLELRRADPAVDNAPTRSLLVEWRNLGGTSEIPASTIALALETADILKSQEIVESPEIELVWTGPTVSSSGLRTTYQVVRELIAGARHSLLLVGYSFNLNPDLPGAGAVLATDLGRALTRGVHLTLIIHDDASNWRSIDRLWHSTQKQIRVLTWTEDRVTEWAKLHAKVVIADNSDLLVTSANLTYHGMEKNMELGIRLRSKICGTVVSHFNSLERTGILRPRSG